MKNKNGFTLIELLAVIVVLAITFLFVIPKMVSLVNEAKGTSVQMFEEKMVDAAKEYAYNGDNTFFKDFVNEGDYKIITDSDLLNANLVSEKDIDKLDGFTGVKVELISNNEFKYTIMYE